jgi:hypothetical protein
VINVMALIAQFVVWQSGEQGKGRKKRGESEPASSYGIYNQTIYDKLDYIQNKGMYDLCRHVPPCGIVHIRQGSQVSQSSVSSPEHSYTLHL